MTRANLQVILPHGTTRRHAKTRALALSSDERATRSQTAGQRAATRRARSPTWSARPRISSRSRGSSTSFARGCRTPRARAPCAAGSTTIGSSPRSSSKSWSCRHRITFCQWAPGRRGEQISKAIRAHRGRCARGRAPTSSSSPETWIGATQAQSWPPVPGYRSRRVGLRSFDRTMPEDINRLLVDRVSNWCFIHSRRPRQSGARGRPNGSSSSGTR